MALVRKLKKAASEASGMIYSDAELHGRCVQSRPTLETPATHESARESFMDAKMGIDGSTSHNRCVPFSYLSHLPWYPHRYCR